MKTGTSQRQTVTIISTLAARTHALTSAHNHEQMTHSELKMQDGNRAHFVEIWRNKKAGIRNSRSDYRTIRRVHFVQAKTKVPVPVVSCIEVFPQILFVCIACGRTPKPEGFFFIFNNFK